METQEQAILKRISEARGTSEPEQSAPTEELTAVNVSDEAPEDDSQLQTEEVERQEIAEQTDETLSESEEEVVSDEQVTTDTNDDEDLYVEYKGREINLNFNLIDL